MDEIFEEYRRVFYADDEVRKVFSSAKGYLAAWRRIPLIGKLDEKYIAQVMLTLIRMDYEEDSPITLLMCSPGGDAVSCYQLIDLFSTLNSPVHIVAFSDNSSMAIDLLQAADKRFLFPNARLLLHYIRHGREWIGDNPEQVKQDLEIFMKNLEAIRKKRFKLYEEKTKLTTNELEQLFRYGEVHGASISADLAVEMNLADEIVSDFKLFPNRTYERKK